MSCGYNTIAIIGQPGAAGAPGAAYMGYEYFAWASDGAGTNFSFTYDESVHTHKSRLIKISTVVPPDPLQGEFTLWERIRGKDPDNNSYVILQLSQTSEKWYFNLPFSYKVFETANQGVSSPSATLHFNDGVVNNPNTTYEVTLNGVVGSFITFRFEKVS